MCMYVCVEDGGGIHDDSTKYMIVHLFDGFLLCVCHRCDLRCSHNKCNIKQFCC